MLIDLTRYFVFYTEDDPGEKGHHVLIKGCKKINAAMGYRRRRIEGNSIRWEGFVILRGKQGTVANISMYFPGFHILKAPSWLDLEESELPEDITVYGSHPYINVKKNLNDIFESENDYQMAEILCSISSIVSDITDGYSSNN